VSSNRAKDIDNSGSSCCNKKIYDLERSAMLTSGSIAMYFWAAAAVMGAFAIAEKRAISVVRVGRRLISEMLPYKKSPKTVSCTFRL
jgi:hypothetical protein